MFGFVAQEPAARSATLATVKATVVINRLQQPAVAPRNTISLLAPALYCLHIWKPSVPIHLDSPPLKQARIL